MLARCLACGAEYEFKGVGACVSCGSRALETFVELNWTTDKPTEPGVYVYCRSRGRPCSVVTLFVRDNGELGVRDDGSRDCVQWDAHWLGPLPEIPNAP